MRSGGWWVGIALALCSASGWAQVELLLIGTYTNTDAHSRGIYSALFDTKTGAITNLKVAAEAANPSFLARHPSRPFLYAVNEMPDGMVSSFAIRAGGELMLIGSTSTGGAAPCHLIVDRSEKWLLAANYNGGSIAVFPILADGSAGKATVIQHSGSGPSPRQKGPHPHEIVELGGNIVVVTVDATTGKLTRTGSAPTGAGPRFFMIDAGGKWLLAAGQASNTITVFAIDPANGLLHPQGKQFDVPSPVFMAASAGH